MQRMDKSNVFWKNESARAMLERFEKEAQAAGYDFMLVITDRKTKDMRTLYHCEEEGHVTLTKALDAAYDQILAWYQSRMTQGTAH